MICMYIKCDNSLVAWKVNESHMKIYAIFSEFHILKPIHHIHVHKNLIILYSYCDSQFY